MDFDWPKSGFIKMMCCFGHKCPHFFKNVSAASVSISCLNLGEGCSSSWWILARQEPQIQISPAYLVILLCVDRV